MKKIFLFLYILFLGVNVFAQNNINLNKMPFIGKVDERFQSFNVKMCEVIGGDFWIPYNLIDSVGKTTNKKGIDNFGQTDLF